MPTDAATSATMAATAAMLLEDVDVLGPHYMRWIFGSRLTLI